MQGSLLIYVLYNVLNCYAAIKTHSTLNYWYSKVTLSSFLTVESFGVARNVLCKCTDTYRE